MRERRADATDAGRVVAAAKPDFSLIDENLLKSRIHTIRGVKVMLDADLAEIYGYSTKRFNEQVKNNIEKFDEDFRFQLTSEEAVACSRSKKSALNSGGRGSNIKYNPFAFTEQGIYMLMTVLKGERAIAQSKALIRLFKQMKDYIVAENQLLLGNNAITEIAAQTIQNTRDIALLSNEMRDNRESLQKVMENFVDPASFRHYLILNGQKLEADVAYAQIYGMAKKSVMVLDNYLDYGLDSEKLFHCGASSKDAGGKVTTIMQIERPEVYHSLIEALGNEYS